MVRTGDGRDHRGVAMPRAPSCHEWMSPPPPPGGRRDRRGPGRRSPLRRVESGAMLGGIAAGLSARTRIDVTLVRIGLVVAVLLSGGVVAAAYVIAWLLLPVDGQ